MHEVVRDPAGGVTVRVRGEIDVATADRFARVLDEVCASRPTRVVLDMERASFVDAAGVQVIAGAAGVLTRMGCPLVVIRPQRIVRQVFELTGFGTLLGT